MFATTRPQTPPRFDMADRQTDWSGWQKWLDSYLAIEANKNRAVFDDIHDAFVRGEDRFAQLEQQVAELRGAMDVIGAQGKGGERLIERALRHLERAHNGVRVTR